MTWPLATAPAAARRSTSHRALRVNECRAVLERTGWGVLSTAHEGQPYAVPVAFAIDDSHLYLASGPGRKLRNMELNPRICVTVSEVEHYDQWSCVVITGPVQWVTDFRSRKAAMRAFVRQHLLGRSVPPGNLKHLLHARIARLSLTEMTGRARG